MNILLDECVPWPLSALLKDHTCTSPHRRGWSGVSNGALLKRAEEEFDCFITADQNIRYQQQLKGRKIAIIELSTNDLRRIVSAAAEIRGALATIQAGEFLGLTIP